MAQTMLTEFECDFCRWVGKERRLSAVENRRCQPYGEPPGDLVENDVQGAAAEYAVHLALKVPWRPLKKTLHDDHRDVSGVEVRSTLKRHGCLIVHDRDSDSAPFILVTGEMPSLRIVGWLYGRECKRPEFWRTDVRTPAYFVPQGELRSMEEW